MSQHEDEMEIAREERHIYAIVVAASLPVVFAIAVDGGAMDGGATLSLVLTVLGVVGLIAGIIGGLRALLKQRLPRATAMND